MDILDYYKTVFPQLENCYSNTDYFLANEKTLVDEYGADPAFPAVTFEKKDLYYVTAERGFQVHLPVLGYNVSNKMNFQVYV